MTWSAVLEYAVCLVVIGVATAIETSLFHGDPMTIFAATMAGVSLCYGIVTRQARETK